MVKFHDAEIQQVFQRYFEIPQDFHEREIRCLMATYDWFRIFEGEQSPRVAAIVEQMLASGCRPALRRWYRRAGDKMNPTAIAFRERLSRLAGERFG